MVNWSERSIYRKAKLTESEPSLDRPHTKRKGTQAEKSSGFLLIQENWNLRLQFEFATKPRCAENEKWENLKFYQTYLHEVNGRKWRRPGAYRTSMEENKI